jgi:hypothetical protein
MNFGYSPSRPSPLKSTPASFRSFLVEVSNPTIQKKMLKAADSPVKKMLGLFISNTFFFSFITSILFLFTQTHANCLSINSEQRRRLCLLGQSFIKLKIFLRRGLCRYFYYTILTAIICNPVKEEYRFFYKLQSFYISLYFSAPSAPCYSFGSHSID